MFLSAILRNMEFRNLRYSGYLAGSDGYIYSVIYNKGKNDGTPKRLKASRGKTSPYLKVNIRCSPGVYKNVLVHSLICEAYHGPRPDQMVCSHLDGNLNNNVPGNLVWETQSDNLKRRINHGTDDCGHRNSRAKLSADDVAAIKRRLAGGDLHADIARDYGISRTVITRISSGTRYAR